MPKRVHRVGQGAVYWVGAGFACIDLLESSAQPGYGLQLAALDIDRVVGQPTEAVKRIGGLTHVIGEQQ